MFADNPNSYFQANEYIIVILPQALQCLRKIPQYRLYVSS